MTYVTDPFWLYGMYFALLVAICLAAFFFAWKS
jgi:hypothetical protein